MKKLIAAVALAIAIASPAFAQSYDPDLGSGNIVQFEAPASQSAAQSAFAQVRPGAPAATHRSNRHGGERVTSPYSAYGAVTPFGSPAKATEDGTGDGGPRVQPARCRLQGNDLGHHANPAVPELHGATRPARSEVRLRLEGARLARAQVHVGERRRDAALHYQ